MFISCLLASTGLTSADAMKIYAHRRTSNNKGVTIPSQRIYVDLFKQYCSDIAGYNDRLKAAKSLKQIDLHGMVLTDEDHVFFQIQCKNQFSFFGSCVYKKYFNNSVESIT